MCMTGMKGKDIHAGVSVEYQSHGGKECSAWEWFRNKFTLLERLPLRVVALWRVLVQVRATKERGKLRRRMKKQEEEGVKGGDGDQSFVFRLKDDKDIQDEK